MNKQIFIINGSGGKGKDAFVKIISKRIKFIIISRVMNISSIDKIRKASKILGWDESKDETSRLFLSNMKLLSIKYNNHPFNYIKSKIEKFNSSKWFKLMFIHIREPREIDKVKNEFNCKTILIKNINIKDIKSNMADANVENYQYDYIIENNGNLEDLKIEAINFIKNIKEV